MQKKAEVTYNDVIMMILMNKCRQMNNTLILQEIEELEEEEYANQENDAVYDPDDYSDVEPETLEDINRRINLQLYNDFMIRNALLGVRSAPVPFERYRNVEVFNPEEDVVENNSIDWKELTSFSSCPPTVVVSEDEGEEEDLDPTIDFSEEINLNDMY